MRKLRWSQLALNDLDRIRAFLVERDIGSSRRVIGAIRERARLLKEHPMAGSPLDIGDARKLSVGRFPYLLIYRVLGEYVVVTRVHHGAEDWRHH